MGCIKCRVASGAEGTWVQRVQGCRGCRGAGLMSAGGSESARGAEAQGSRGPWLPLVAPSNH